MAQGGETPRNLADLLLQPRRTSLSAQRQPERDAPSEGRQLDLLFSSAAPPRELTPAVSSRTEPQATAAAQSRRIWTVAALVSEVRQSLESGYDNVWVVGEVSACRPAPSGHLYFTLRDGEAQISSVIFRRQAQLLRFAVRDGMHVLARGRVSLFEQRGQLQFIADTLEPRGAGSQQFAFEQLKAKLLAEGLFDTARKRPLPPFPQRIGVVTSPAGAVVHDIIQVIRRRHACLDLLIYPAIVQGADSPGAVAAGIRWFNREAASFSEGKTETHRVDLIVIARGGGSPDDLAGFNDEALARTIAASELPVVSAVGHETDFTIADFVADLRAPTPSAAAELITAVQHQIADRVTALDARLHRAVRYQLILKRQRLSRLSADQVLSGVRDAAARRGQRLDDLHRQFQASAARHIDSALIRLSTLQARLERHHPAQTLHALRRRLELARLSLDHLAAGHLAPAANRLRHAQGRLEALSPVAVLSRGYALVYAEDGRLLRSAAEAQPGSVIRARLGEGSLDAEVLSTDPPTPRT